MSYLREKRNADGSTETQYHRVQHMVQRTNGSKKGETKVTDGQYVSELLAAITVTIVVLIIGITIFGSFDNE
jgi:hypothetical protein